MKEKLAGLVFVEGVGFGRGACIAGRIEDGAGDAEEADAVGEGDVGAGAYWGGGDDVFFFDGDDAVGDSGGGFADPHRFVPVGVAFEEVDGGAAELGVAAMCGGEHKALDYGGVADAFAGA